MDYTIPRLLVENIRQVYVAHDNSVIYRPDSESIHCMFLGQVDFIVYEIDCLLKSWKFPQIIYKY